MRYYNIKCYIPSYSCCANKYNLNFKLYVYMYDDYIDLAEHEIVS